MSTLASATFDSSDSEADADFVPTEPKTKSAPRKSKRKTANADPPQSKPSKASKGSKSKSVKRARDEDASSATATDSDSDSEAGEDEVDGAEVTEEAKRLREEAKEAAAEERRRKAKDAFDSIREEGAMGGPSSSQAGPSEEKGSGKPRMVQVSRHTWFAGELVREVRLMPETNFQAISDLMREWADSGVTMGPPDDEEGGSPGAPGPNKPDDSVPASALDTSLSPSTAAPSTKPKPSAKPGPTRKKPRQSLESLASSLGTAKKLTTLEKSQMDWKAHLAGAGAEGERDELEANRRGGGYLERQEFLGRVGERKEALGKGGRGKKVAR